MTESLSLKLSDNQLLEMAQKLMGKEETTTRPKLYNELDKRFTDSSKQPYRSKQEGYQGRIGGGLLIGSVSLIFALVLSLGVYLAGVSSSVTAPALLAGTFGGIAGICVIASLAGFVVAVISRYKLREHNNEDIDSFKAAGILKKLFEKLNNNLADQQQRCERENKLLNTREDHLRIFSDMMGNNDKIIVF